MVKMIYRRTGHPRIIYADAPLPFNPGLGAAGLGLEVAAVSDWVAVTTGALSDTSVAPAAAKEMGRYHFSEGTGATVTDQSSFLTNIAATPSADIPNEGAWAAGGFDFVGRFADDLRFQAASSAGMNATKLHIFVAHRAEAQGSTDAVNGKFLVERGDSTSTGQVWRLSYSYDNRTLNFGRFSETGAGNFVNSDTGVVVQDAWHVYEAEVDGLKVILRRDGEQVGIGYLSAGLRSAVAPIVMGNRLTGNRAVAGVIGYVALYKGGLTRDEADFARKHARDVMVGKTITMPALVPLPPAKAPHFTSMPSLSTDSTPAQTPITLNMGRAKGDPLPITDLSVTLDGVDITPAESLIVTPQTGGRLLVNFRADNGIYQPKTITLGADISTPYPILTKAQIQSALGITDDIFMSDFDAGFPTDMSWSPSNLVDGSAALDASVLGFRVRKNPSGSSRKYGGGEVQIQKPHRIGRYDAMLRLHEGVPGTVQTIFMFQQPHTDKHREFDFEILSDGHVPVQGDTTTTFSTTCRADCAAHIQPLSTGSNQHRKLQCDVPKEAFTAFQKWSIVYNGDRTEWLYNDRLMSRYIQGQGFDESIQEFNPTVEGTTTRYNAAYVTANGKHILPTDAGWHVGTIKPFMQQWASDTNPTWIGTINLPPDPPLFRVDNVVVSPFSSASIAFAAANWSVSQTAITVSAMRIPRFRPTAIQYSTDGGTVWTDLANSTGPGTYAVTLAAATNVIIRPRVRVVNGRIDSGVISDFVLEGANSDTKTVA